MMKANLKKMILATAMAAFMVSAPAMAEEAEDIIVEDSFEEAAEIAAVEEAPVVEIEVIGFETIAVAEIPEEVAEEAEQQISEEPAAETETEQQARTFTYENEEVIITAQAAAELPENIEMQVRKIEEGSAEYEAAKQAAAASCEAGEDAQYRFYDVTFAVDGNEVELADGSVYVQIEFKTVQINSAAGMQEVLHIDEAGVNNVTAETAEGSNMSSVSFAI